MSELNKNNFKICVTNGDICCTNKCKSVNKFVIIVDDTDNCVESPNCAESSKCIREAKCVDTLKCNEQPECVETSKCNEHSECVETLDPIKQLKSIKLPEYHEMPKYIKSSKCKTSNFHHKTKEKHRYDRLIREAPTHDVMYYNSTASTILAIIAIYFLSCLSSRY
jgi:hypothetical protein